MYLKIQINFSTGSWKKTEAEKSVNYLCQNPVIQGWKPWEDYENENAL